MKGILAGCVLGCLLLGTGCGSNKGRADGFWGDAPDLEDRQAVFEALWGDVRRNYGAFAASELDWDRMHDRMAPQIDGAESYGEFYALLSHAFGDMRDANNLISSRAVCSTPVTERPPVFFTQDPESYRSGAQNLGLCVTALADDTVLVYDAAPDNPAGLRPGDRIIGFDERPLRALLTEAMELPMCGRHAASAQAEDELLLRSLVSNVHLFDEMIVFPHDAFQPVTIPTEDLLTSAYPDLLCTDRIDPRELRAWDDWMDAAQPDRSIAWTIDPASSIGYITADSWDDETPVPFLQAVSDLAYTDGMIVDLRFSEGGTMFSAFLGMRQLFQEDVHDRFAIGIRDNPGDPYSLEIFSHEYDLIADPDTYYDRPIAILTGPQTSGAGEIVAYYLSQHPRARRFGRSSNGSPCYVDGDGSLWNRDPILDDLTVRRTTCVGLDAARSPFAADAVAPDVEVWLRPADVVSGTDTVVETARAWIAAENASQ